MSEPVSRPSTAKPLPDWFAIVLVTGTSGVVLVLEILAGRMLAPYVGVNLETYTAVIGTILAGIAVGARAGGAIADRVDPRRLIPMFLTVGGALAMSSIPIVRTLGGASGASGSGAPSVVLAALGFLPSAAVLSAVPPAVVKLQLRSLDETGTTVGRLSAWSTGGAIAGTFLAGFVLVTFAAVTTLIVAIGLLVIAGGAAMWVIGPRGDHRPVVAGAALAVVSLGGMVAIDEPCDVETAYSCVSIEVDGDRPTGRVLVLDDLRHSYVDLADPTHLEFWYVRQIVGAIEHLGPTGPVDVVSIGGGALTVPRYVRATRPGSAQTVLEIDRELVGLVESRLGFVPADDISVVTGDARPALRGVPSDSADVVVGDAFGSRAVPWHLTTAEFVADIDRVLRPDGIYVVNLIDGGDEQFLRAEVATIRRSFRHAAVVRGPGLDDGSIGNSVIVASDAPLDVAGWDAARRARGDGGQLVDDVAAYAHGALVLTDDYAPVDQLIVGLR